MNQNNVEIHPFLAQHNGNSIVKSLLYICKCCCTVTFNINVWVCLYVYSSLQFSFFLRRSAFLHFYIYLLKSGKNDIIWWQFSKVCVWMGRRIFFLILILFIQYDWQSSMEGFPLYHYVYDFIYVYVHICIYICYYMNIYVLLFAYGSDI